MDNNRKIPQQEVMIRQLPEVEKIVNNETWYEGERRGHFVPSDDPVVQEKVVEVLLKIGGRMRKKALEQILEFGIINR